MASNEIVVDADGHILEPPDLWERYLEAKYQPHAIKVVKNEKGLECLQYDGKLSQMAQPGFLAALGGMGKEQDQLKPNAERTYVGCAPFGSMDARERVELLDRENLAKAVLYPTLGILWEAEVEDVELSQAYCRAYNRWIADFCRPYSDRLIPIAHLSLGDPQAAAIELERAVKDGCRGAFVAPFTITRKPHGHPDHDVVFAMCEKLDVPFAIHPTFEPKGLNRARFHGMDRMPLMGVIASHMLQQPLSTFFQFGTFDKFRKLRVVVLESGSSWLGFWMDRMDEGFETWIGGTIPLKHKPSEYVRKQVWISGDPDEQATAYVVDYVGKDRFFWASDFPHPDHGGKYLDALERMVKPMSPEARRAIVGQNVLDCYKL
ncbi:MAG TPA: amidohydrolase family protein [Candidatus Binataceae bacterium]|nr:amidohydrolase family protein [Candidatus Binataceae bacterium]